MSDTDRKGSLLLALQRGVPLCARPFAELARRLGMSEQDVLQAVHALFERGVARRFGAVFDSRRLGYGSTLCAAEVPAGELERAADRLAPHTGITHCYEREGRPNLWFTVTAPAARLREQVDAFADDLTPCPLLDLPALRRFKVEVVLDAPGRKAAAGNAAPAADDDTQPLDWPEPARAVVRALQGNLAVSPEPFAAVAGELGRDPRELLALLADWKQHGVLRRVAIILRHREAGFRANGMCVWRVPEDQVERAGRRLAACPEVTHCYQRPCPASFPFNLFAMVHARERPEAERIFHSLSARAALEPGRMLMSVREFKKSSPVFFCEKT